MTSYLDSGYDVMICFAKFEKFLPHSIIMPSFMSVGRCMIKIFRGGRGGDTFKLPSPLRTTFAFTSPCFKMFLERSLNDSRTTHHPTSNNLHCYPPPHPPSPPLKILIIHRSNARVRHGGGAFLPLPNMK